MLTDADYRAALREASAMFDDPPEPGTERGDYFEVLTTLIEAYEMKTFLDWKFGCPGSSECV